MFEHAGERFDLVAVVAMARNRVIGLDGDMPWRVRADLKRYRALTMGRPMVMGRKTLVSIGRILEGRDTIVLTSSGYVPIEGAIPAATPDEALARAAERAMARGVREIAIVGGAQIYQIYLDRLDRVELTRIEAEPGGDTWFPDLDQAVWSCEFVEDLAVSDGDTAKASAFKLSRSNGCAA